MNSDINETERLKDLHAEILSEQEFTLRKEIEVANQERDLYKTKDAQWKIKYAQTMDTWAEQSVNRDASEDAMKRLIREYVEEKDQSGDWRKAKEILAAIGENYIPKPI